MSDAVVSSRYLACFVVASRVLNAWTISFLALEVLAGSSYVLRYLARKMSVENPAWSRSHLRGAR